MMAQPIECDICREEPAAQMLTNLETGETIAAGAACLPVFYGQSVLTLMDAGEHKGLPQKCQACRRVHERMTLTADPANVRAQPAAALGPPTPASQLADTVADIIDPPAAAGGRVDLGDDPDGDADPDGEQAAIAAVQAKRKQAGA
jgi:hypothetical protein